MNTWVFIDLETTGLRQETDKIIEIGLVRRADPDERMIWGRLVNPGRPLEPLISRITGIDDGMLAQAPALTELAGEVGAFLEDAVIVAHNAAFDVGFLEQRLGVTIDGDRVIDTIELAKILYPGLRSYSLRSLVRSFRLPVLPNHRAEDDAIALEQIFLRLAEKAGRLSRGLLTQIVTALGGEKKGLAVFFTELLMGRKPEWLAKAIPPAGAGTGSDAGKMAPAVLTGVSAASAASAAPGAAAGESGGDAAEDADWAYANARSNGQILPFGAAEEGWTDADWTDAGWMDAGRTEDGKASAGSIGGACGSAGSAGNAGGTGVSGGIGAAVGGAARGQGPEGEGFAPGGGDKANEKAEQKERLLAQAFWREGRMAGLLREDGALAGKMANYQRRGQQEEMLGLVAKAFTESRCLMIEAPTGVGKSLAYLIPALCWAKAFGHRVVVATHTITLQEQLFSKEVALLKDLLPFSFQSVMLKGRGNYLCISRWQQVMAQGRALIWGERILLARLAIWLAEGARGDLDSIHLLGPEREWFAQMASARETCQGGQCPHYKRCFFQKARLGANASQLVIVNHALLLSASRLGEKVLPKFSYLVIDEAHHLEEEGTRQFTDTFSLLEYEKKLQQLHRRRDVFGRPGFLQYLKEYRQQGARALENLEPHLEEMEKQLKAVMKRVNSLQAMLPNSSLPDMFRIKPGRPRGNHLQGMIVQLDNLLVMAGELKKVLDRVGLILQGDEGDLFDETWRKQQLQLFGEVNGDTALLESFLRGIADDGRRSLAGGTGAEGGPFAPAGSVREAFPEVSPDTFPEVSPEGGQSGPDGTAQPGFSEERVYWVTRDLRQKDIALCLTPLNMAVCFQKYLFAGKDSVVLTSATLSVNEGFTYCRQQLGIDPEIVDSRILNSPFDHARQVLLLSDKDLPNPAKTAESAYNLALAQSLEVLLEACGGRSMVLFTSHKQLRAMFDALYQPLRLAGLELFADGQNGSRSTLLAELRANEKAVVFGANTFWEGVDLPGLFLTSLLIVRLPFAPPGQPLTEARIEKMEAEGKDPFYQYSLPQAVLRFKQGYGRLIRTAQDWGVVVVLDNRIMNKGYGRVFLQSLPGGRCLGASPGLLAKKIQEWRRIKMGGGKDGRADG